MPVVLFIPIAMYLVQAIQVLVVFLVLCYLLARGKKGFITPLKSPIHWVIILIFITPWPSHSNDYEFFAPVIISIGRAFFGGLGGSILDPATIMIAVVVLIPILMASIKNKNQNHQREAPNQLFNPDPTVTIFQHHRYTRPTVGPVNAGR